MAGSKTDQNPSHYMDFRAKARQTVFNAPSKSVMQDYVQSRHYLQLVGTVNPETLLTELKQDGLNLNDLAEMTGDRAYPVPLETGWVVQYWSPTPQYPAAMATSIGMRSYGLSTNDPELAGLDEPELMQELPEPTPVDQAFNTAGYMVLLAINEGWQSIHVVAGSPLMKWAVWAVAEENSLPVTGFEPSETDRAKRDRNAWVLSTQFHVPDLQAGLAPGMASSSGGQNSPNASSEDAHSTDEDP